LVSSAEAAVLARARGLHLSEQLAAAARKRPERAALRCAGEGLSYLELDERASRIGNALSARGVRRGDRVILLSANRFEWVETFFGIVRVGAIVVPLNFRLAPAEVAGIVADTQPSAIVVEAELRPLLAEAGGWSGPTLVIGGAGESYDTARAEAAATRPEVELADEDPATICFTSGTTGRPKGAVLTHRNLAVNVMSVMVALSLREDDAVWASGSPLFHVGGFGDLLVHLPVCGTFVILPTGGFDAAAIVDELERENATGCSFVPTQWQDICALPGIKERPFAQRLRRAGYGSASSPMALLETLLETFPNADRIHAFGQTEMSPTTTILNGDDAVRKVGSVGRAIACIELRIVDDDMNDVPVGDVGEVVYRGPCVFAGYWNRPDADAEAFAGGWFHSGDLCRMDDEGYVYVVDRKKDMIISGGENIFSAEVENAIASHPDVHEVAVVALPHEVWGETPAAGIVPRDAASPPSSDEIVAWCRERLASYKKPTVVEVFDALPHNSTGKVVKADLRHLIMERIAR
jgi:fatty-acyl-CoA synthase/long-chain acyl-CoA synthetase